MSEHINKYHKGAEWRRWDLHIHTPGTKKADRFLGSTLDEKWQNFVHEINSNTEPVSVIGITDYFCIQNYFKFKSLVENGAITKQFELILPNIELRITPIAVSAPVNIHCIFNPSIAEQIEDRFLSNLSFSHGSTNYNASRQSLIRLGRARTGNPSLPETEAQIAGIDVFVISADTLRTVFEKDPDLRKNTVIVVSNKDGDGASGIVKHEEYFNSTGSQLDAVRESIYQLSDAIFSSNDGDRNYFLGLKADNKETVIKKAGSLKPCFHGSDAHESSKLFRPDGNRFCWIKSDPTFEGLKQVLYEPEDRVKIHPNIPEDKPGYQVIDRIVIASNSIFNTQLYLNPNLNCIIGGRSSGKSVLLGAIAKKVKSSRQFSLSDPEYQLYVQSVADSISVIWKDGKEENDREIEYFEQGYMHDIARNDNKLNDIIRDILIQKGKEALLESYSKFTTQNSKAISGLISDYFRFLLDIKEKEQKVRDKGDKTGIEDEIVKLKGELERLSVTTISEDDKIKYEEVKQAIETNKQKNQILNTDVAQIDILKELGIFKDNVEYELISISDLRKKAVSEVFAEIKIEAEKKWRDELNNLAQTLVGEIEECIKENEVLEKNEVYTKVLKAYEENAQLSEYEQKIKVQNDKLFEITNLLNEVESLRKQLSQTKEKIKVSHKQYFDKINELIPDLSDIKDGLEIKAKWKFEVDRYRNLLYTGLNQQGFSNQELSNYEFKGFDDFESHQFKLFEKLEKNQLTLKGAYDNQSLCTSLLSTNFFSLNYDLEYEGDDFRKMSDGKKAFVVLKLLLDFNDKKCPILIDQPEDDLDNRAIYNDLVQYLRSKKRDRQIIVATHNPNIVVGADSELIICANQNGEKNQNNGNKKFQYVTGSLEHTVVKNNSAAIILESQGTREHVCEVLEGGNIAFKLREKKYSIKE